jgi:hypothetical protein
VPTTFSSKIVSNGETSDVTMVLDEGSVKELAASPPPGRERVPVTDANRQGIVDPLTAMLFSARFGRKFAPRGTAHITDLRWPTTLRSQARIQAHGASPYIAYRLSRSDHVFGLVHLRQRFAHRSQGWADRPV